MDFTRRHDTQHNNIQHNGLFATLSITLSKTVLCAIMLSVANCDTQHNDTQHNYIQHNNIQHNGLFGTLSMTLSITVFCSILMSVANCYAECCYAVCRYAECHLQKWTTWSQWLILCSKRHFSIQTIQIEEIWNEI